MKNLQDKTRGRYVRVERAREAQKSLTEPLDLAFSPGKLYVRPWEPNTYKVSMRVLRL